MGCLFLCWFDCLSACLIVSLVSLLVVRTLGSLKSVCFHYLLVRFLVCTFDCFMFVPLCVCMFAFLLVGKGGHLRSRFWVTCAPQPAGVGGHGRVEWVGEPLQRCATPAHASACQMVTPAQARPLSTARMPAEWICQTVSKPASARSVPNGNTLASMPLVNIRLQDQNDALTCAKAPAQSRPKLQQQKPERFRAHDLRSGFAAPKTISHAATAIAIPLARSPQTRAICAQGLPKPRQRPEAGHEPGAQETQNSGAQASPFAGAQERTMSCSFIGLFCFCLLVCLLLACCLSAACLFICSCTYVSLIACSFARLHACSFVGCYVLHFLACLFVCWFVF